MNMMSELSACYSVYVEEPLFQSNPFQFGNFLVDPREVFRILKKESHIQKNATSETDLQLLANVIQLSYKELAECGGSPFDLRTAYDVYLFLADELGRYLRPRFQFGRFTLDPKEIFRLLAANYGIEKKASSETDLQFLQDAIQQCLQELAKWERGIPDLPTLDEAHRFLVTEIAYQRRHKEVCARALDVLNQLGYVNYRLNLSRLEYKIFCQPGILKINKVLKRKFSNYRIISQTTQSVVQNLQNLRLIMTEEPWETSKALKRQAAVQCFTQDVENVVKAVCYTH